MSVNCKGQEKLIMSILSMLTSRSRLLLSSSISARRGSFDPIYAASKGVLISLVKSLVKSLPGGCRINSIAPGLIQGSSEIEGISKERQKFYDEQIPSKKLLHLQDLARIVFDLYQDHWVNLNGACIELNGGQNVR
jgi:3-oxoacyl-[acyl-carrier protein] reductase